MPIASVRFRPHERATENDLSRLAHLPGRKEGSPGAIIAMGILAMGQFLGIEHPERLFDTDPAVWAGGWAAGGG